MAECANVLLLEKVATLGVSKSVVINYVAALEEQYIQNPYHNATHAAMVAHSSVTLARFLGLMQR